MQFICLFACLSVRLSVFKQDCVKPTNLIFMKLGMGGTVV